MAFLLAIGFLSVSATIVLPEATVRAEPGLVVVESTAEPRVTEFDRGGFRIVQVDF